MLFFCLFSSCVLLYGKYNLLIWLSYLLRDTFSCPVLFSLWRVRRSWLRHIVKKCTNIEVQREMFKRLGQIVYGIWGGLDLAVSLEEFLLDFVDQTSFMQYFKDSWLPKIGQMILFCNTFVFMCLCCCHLCLLLLDFLLIYYAAEMWLKLMKTLPLASQEASGAIEAYHVKLKGKLYDDSHLGSLQRVDWLVHKLTTELHSSYWLDRYADESDFFQNVKEDYIASTSWHRALQIPDTSVSFDEKDQLFAKVGSQKDSNLNRLVWNPGSEFAHCDCEWSLQGNLCKHVVKVNMICGNMPSYQSSLSFQSLKTILMDLWKKPMDDSVSLDISTAWTLQILNQVQKLVELNNSDDIGLVVNNMPLKWAAKRARTSSGRQSPILAVNNPAFHKSGKKRTRLSRLR